VGGNKDVSLVINYKIKIK